MPNEQPPDILTLAANIHARKEASEFIEFIGDKPPRFWQELAAMAEAKLPPKPQVIADAMTDEQATRFEKTRVPYGKYQDCEVGEVPTEYLCWLIDGNEFTKGLARYLKTECFKQRQRDEA